MQVILVNYTPNTDSIIAAVAGSSASESTIKEFWRTLNLKHKYNLLKQLLDPYGGADLKLKCYYLGYCRN